jgi:DNA polymerase elongation subunit (family B)
MSNISDHFFRQNEIQYSEDVDFRCQLIDALAIDEEPPEEEDGGFSYNFKGEYTVYFFGVTKKSETVCIRVSGYQPSFFMNVPDNWRSGYNGDTFQLQKHLTSKDATFVDNWGKKKKIKWFNSRNIKLRTFKAKKFDGFQINEHHNFVEIKFNSHIAMKQTYRYLDSIKSKILKVPGVRQFPIKLYEADIDPLLRMCHKSNITPCSWIQLNKGRFTCVDEYDKKSHCQYEFNVNWRDIHPYETDDIAPFLVASYDIECTSGDGSFPQPTRPQDKLIQIGTTVRMFNNPEYELNHIITLKSCNKFTDDPNTIVESYDTEEEVIMAWQQLIQRVNPDIITGYNILGFDYWYLYERAQMFGVEEEFGYLGKLNPDKFENEFIKGKLISKLREKSLSSSALGDNKMKILDMIGRVNIDLLNFVRRTQKFKSYKLDFVSTKIINGEIINCELMENGLCRMSVDNTVGLFKGGYFSINMKTKIELADKDIYIVDDENYFTLNGSKKFLIEDFEKGKYLYVKEDLTQLNKEKCRWGLSKDDVTPAQIFEFQGKDGHHRGIVAKYCVQDCRLCNILMDKLCVIPNEIGMGQTCCVPLSFIFFRGQGIKVQSLVSRQCRKDGYLMPVREKDTSGCSYKGATVLNACNGAHFYPVACLDFASLYPSCMLSHNLCIESVIEDKDMIKELDRQRKAKELISVRETKYQGDQFFYKAKTDVDEPKMIHLKDRLIFPSMWVDEGITYCYYFVQPKRKFDENGNILQDEHGQDIIDFEDRAILPRILRMLLDTRKATKKRMKKEKNPFKKKILDGLQLAYKVTANSIYGATGASVGCISCKKVAGSVTMVGRSLLATSRDKILDYYEGSKCVYGDSVTGDTPILIRYPNGKISIRTIETLNDEWKSYEEFKPFDTNRKEKQQTSVDLECWADNGWAKIKRVIRHKTKKKIYRVNTHCGVIDVTEDHSLMNSKKEKIKPKDCIVGETELFHSYPTEFPEFEPIIPEYGVEEELDLPLYKCNNCSQSFDKNYYYTITRTGKLFKQCKLCIINKQRKRQNREPITKVDEWTWKKLYIPEYDLMEEEAWVFGLFMADGSCGKYGKGIKTKYCWAINKQNSKLLEKARDILNKVEPDCIKFKILDTLKSSSVYKLVPTGSLKYMADKYRPLFYDKDKYKIVPDLILNAPFNIRKSYFEGFYAGDGCKTGPYGLDKRMVFCQKGKIAAQGLFYLAKSIGYDKLSISIQESKENIYWISSCTKWGKEPYVVKKMLDLGYNNENEFVYDIETEHGCFNGGVGEIIEKNTDSVFLHFKVPDKILEEYGLFSDKALDWTIKIAQESGELITHGMWKGKRELVPLPLPHDLEYEKTYLPFILFSKKRYAGWLYEFDTKKPKYLDCKGIILKRRDNCRFLKKIYEGCLYRILNNQLDDSISFLRKSLYDILNNNTLKKYPMSDFIISKTVKSLDKYKVNSKTQDILDQLYEKIEKLKLENEKKNMKMINILNDKVKYYELRKVNIAHVMLALRQKERDPGNAFASNDRVPYCFVEVKGNQKDLLQGDRIETPAYITKENIPLDYLYYIERQLEKPIMQLFEQVDPRAAQLFKDIKRIGTNRKKNLTEITKFFIEEIESENSLISDKEEEEIKLPKKVKKVKKKKKKKKKKKSRIVLEEDSSSDIELPVRRRKKRK